MPEPRFIDYEVEVILSVTTTENDVQAALVRSGIVPGELIGEAIVERVQVDEFPEGDPAVVHPPDPLAGSQAESNGPSGSPTSPSGRAAPEPQDCWCGEAQAGLCPTPERCGERAVAAQEYARKLIRSRENRASTTRGGTMRVRFIIPNRNDPTPEPTREGVAASGRYCEHPHYLGDAITVLENMRVTTEPMEPREMGDIEQRRITALGYLRLEKDRHVTRATCVDHRLDGFVWTCAKCVAAEAERHEEAMRSV